MKKILHFFPAIFIAFALVSCAEVGDNSNERDSQNTTKIHTGFNDVNIENNGLGRTIDLINAESLYERKTGVGSIFDENALASRGLYEEQIRNQEASYTYNSSFEDFYDDWNFEIGAKIGMGKIAKLLTKGIGLSFGVATGYKAVNKEDTKEVYIKMHHNILGKSVELPNYASDFKYYQSILSDDFQKAANKVKSEQDAKRFIDTWGTHVIMAAYYGAAFEATYCNIAHKSYYSESDYAKIEASVEAKSFFEIGFNTSLSTSSSANNEKSTTMFSARAVGGRATNLADFNNLDDFKREYSAYKNWASSLDESNYVLIDFPKNSLYCIWDFLPDSLYSSQKAILDAYFEKACDEKSSELLAKMGVFFSGSYDSKTKTMTYDFSKRSYSGVLTVPPINDSDGSPIETIHFKGSYRTASNTPLRGLRIALDDTWASNSKAKIIFENFAIESSDNSPVLYLPVETTIECRGNNSISSSAYNPISLIDCKKDLTFKSTNGGNITLTPNQVRNANYYEGSIAVKSGGTVTINGTKLVINKADGWNDYTAGRNGGNGSTGIKASKVVIEGNADVEITAGNGANGNAEKDKGKQPEAARSNKVGGHAENGKDGEQGGTGGKGGNGGHAIYADVTVISSTVKLTGGNGGSGGNGGKGGDGGKGGTNTWMNGYAGKGGNGGKGGKAGDGGDGGNAINGSYSNINGAVKLKAGTGGGAGTPGNGGLRGEAGFNGGNMGWAGGHEGSPGDHDGAPGDPGKSGNPGQLHF